MKVEEKPSRGINPSRGDWMNHKWRAGEQEGSTPKYSMYRLCENNLCNTVPCPMNIHNESL